MLLRCPLFLSRSTVLPPSRSLVSVIIMLVKKTLRHLRCPFQLRYPAAMGLPEVEGQAGTHTGLEAGMPSGHGI